MTKKEKKKIDNTSLNLCKNIKNNVFYYLKMN